MEEDRYVWIRSIISRPFSAAYGYCKTNLVLHLSKACRKMVEEKKTIGIMILMG